MYPPPPGVTDVIGLECSGEIIEKGAEATMDWKVGDKAMTLLGGGGYGVCPLLSLSLSIIHLTSNLTLTQTLALALIPNPSPSPNP
jgi:hypothetical protein